MIHWLLKLQGSEKSDNCWEQLLSRQDLGYLQLPQRENNWSDSMAFAEQIRSEADLLVVLGMGGSALGGQLLCEALGQQEKQVLFLKNSDPLHLEKAISEIKAHSKQRVAYLIVSKSGGTIEISALISALSSSKDLSFLEAKKFVITEEKPSLLYNWAQKNKVPILAHPKDVGGRFSIFSTVGLVPAAFASVDLVGLRQGALKALEDSANLVAFCDWAYESFMSGSRMTVFWSYIEAFDLFLPWAQQLWAESLGKNENLLASVPVLSYGATDQHSVLQQYLESENDKNFVFFRDRSMVDRGPKLDAELAMGQEHLQGISLGQLLMAQSKGTQTALENEGYNCMSIEVDHSDAHHLGQLIMSFELITGLLGERLEINAYDQPSVEKGKKITLQLLKEINR